MTSPITSAQPCMQNKFGAKQIVSKTHSLLPLLNNKIKKIVIWLKRNLEVLDSFTLSRFFLGLRAENYAGLINNMLTAYQKLRWLMSLKRHFLQSAKDAEYRGVWLPQWVSWNDTKQNDSEASVILEFWGMQSTPSLPSLLGPLRQETQKKIACPGSWYNKKLKKILIWCL